jgi:hypothetical protein
MKNRMRALFAVACGVAGFLAGGYAGAMACAVVLHPGQFSGGLSHGDAEAVVTVGGIAGIAFGWIAAGAG